MSLPDASQTTQPIQLLDLGRQHRPLRQQVLEALAQVYDSGAFVLGPEVKKLEITFAQYCRVPHAIGCASGSDALLLALMALGVGQGDEVILPSFTFFSTATAVTRLGARPVFADIDPQTFTMDPRHVARLITARTKVLLPVHLFGQCADMEAIGRLAAEAGLAVVEDCAQSIGAQWDGQPCGSIGDIGCFSFYPTKNLGGAGDGGMLTTRRDDLVERLRLLRAHGMEPRYYHKLIGINSRLDSFQAAVLNVKFPYLEQWTTARQANAARYQELFTHAGLDRILGLPQTNPRCRHVWNQYVIRTPGGKRDALRAYLAEAKIGTEIYYPLGLHQQECFQFLGYRPGDLPETERAAQEVLALPIFPELTPAEQERVVGTIAGFYRSSAAAAASPQTSASIPPPKFLQSPQVAPNQSVPVRRQAD
ncbi:MAG TPA: DegT/DnrJ/EryC1/StrS family aminotransferase [Thermoguttaceae bacterium]|nr:DegT/DnrJ/EryC1/StrS family aminotransferase [Thermoguttaceae bacterium]